ncbi:MAG: ABC transporter ATP-binding protein [Alicyclobacillaceae bacterium]|nr:ABC transporter ATP-binding protein [Alicyclobacillaceae bacterium]
MSDRKPYLVMKQVTKIFRSKRTAYHALDSVDLEVRKGEFVSLIGPSGCGKSTLLNIAAGLISPTEGSVWLDGKPVTGPGRDRGMVFQSHALFPWMTVLENIVFALECGKGGAAGRSEEGGWKEEVARRYLERVQLAHAADKRPHEISGGMKQRVGIARAMAVQPKVFLLDEPFGALDALTRSSLQEELVRIWEQDRRTVLMVTHDIEEAIVLSDTIVVMTSGPRAKVREVLSVDIPRPRDKQALLDIPEYRHMKKELLGMLLPKDSAVST